MGKISNEVKKMTQDQILTFEESGEIFFGSHLLTLEDIKVIVFLSMVKMYPVFILIPLTCSVFIQTNLSVKGLCLNIVARGNLSPLIK